MKTLLAIVLASLIVFSVKAQAADTNSITPTPSPELKAAAISFAQLTASNRNLTIATYPMYAPDIVVDGKKDNFGVGIALLTPVSALPALQDSTIAKHSFIGLRFDYLAHQAFASTVGVGVKGDMQLWGHNFTGFVHSGANLPFAGFGVKNGDIGAMVGAGGYTSIWQFTHGSLGIQVSAEHWTQFSGMVFLGGPVLNISF